MQKFYDSNALLNLQEKAFVKDECFLISDITLKEIENIKTSLRKDEEIKYKARKLSKLLKLHRNDNTYKIIMQGRFKRNYKLWKNQLEKENDNIIIIDTEDALLVCNKAHTQDIKEIVEKLKSNGMIDYL